MKPKLALAVLNFASICFTTALTSPVLATVSEPSPKPIVFISQPAESEWMLKAEGLKKWEKQLLQHLGLEYAEDGECAGYTCTCTRGRGKKGDVDYCS